MKLAFVFQAFGGLPVDAVPVVIPFAQWHEAANYEEFTNLPQKS